MHGEEHHIRGYFSFLSSVASIFISINVTILCNTFRNPVIWFPYIMRCTHADTWPVESCSLSPTCKFCSTYYHFEQSYYRLFGRNSMESHVAPTIFPFRPILTLKITDNASCPYNSSANQSISKRNTGTTERKMNCSPPLASEIVTVRTQCSRDILVITPVDSDRRIYSSFIARSPGILNRRSRRISPC